jgi:hypothetical protein
VAANRKLPRARDVPRKNKSGSGKPKAETADDDDDGKNDDENDDASNESISGSRPKTFQGRERGRIFNFPPTFSASQVKTRARCRAVNRKVFLPFLSSSRRKLRHFVRPVCRSASICLRSISSFGRSPEEQSGMSRDLRSSGTERNATSETSLNDIHCIF